MKNLLHHYFKWIMVGLGILALVIASHFIGKDPFIFKLCLVSSGIFVFGALVGMVVETISD